MRTSLELVVAAIVLLIVAVVVLGIFSGGIQNFTNIFNAQSDQQIKINLCATACVNYCFLHPQTDQAKTIPWVTSSSGQAGDGTQTAGVVKPTYKGEQIECGSIYGGPCVCNK